MRWNRLNTGLFIAKFLIASIDKSSSYLTTPFQVVAVRGHLHIDGLSSNWTVDSGVWSILDSQYLQTTGNSPSNTYHRRIRFSEAGSAVMDPKISIKAKALGAPQSDAHAFVMYTKKDANVGLAGFDWDATNQQFNWVITDYHDAEQWWVYGDDGKDATQWIGFDVEVAGARVEIKEGGDTPISETFEEPIPQGAVGLATFNRNAMFDDFSIDEAEYEVSRVFTNSLEEIAGIIVMREYTTPETYTDTWLHYDALGSVMNHSGASGAATATHHQDAYGNVIDASTGAWLDEVSQEGFHLTTKEYDSVPELYYFMFRWYCPKTGRFTTRDLMPQWAEVNPYYYVGHRPTFFVDPLGELKETGNVPRNRTCGDAEICAQIKDIEARLGEVEKQLKGEAVGYQSRHGKGTTVAQLKCYRLYLKIVGPIVAELNWLNPFNISCLDYCATQHESVHEAQCYDLKPSGYFAMANSPNWDERWSLERPALEEEQKCLQKKVNRYKAINKKP